MPPAGCVLSPNRSYALVMQSSGALDLAQVTPAGQLGKAVWTSASHGSSPDAAAADLQADGNLVIYEGAKPIWNTQSAGPAGNFALAVTDDGNVVIRNAKGASTWSSKFDPRTCPMGLDAPSQLAVGGCVTSPGKTYVMTVEKAGAIQVAPIGANGAVGKSIWSSGNHLTSVGATMLALQEDGNLVIYVNNKAVWNSYTNGPKSAFHLDLADDGELKLHKGDGAVIWSSKTGKAKS